MNVKKLNKYVNLFIVLIILLLLMLTCYLFMHGEMTRNKMILGLVLSFIILMYSFALTWKVESKLNLLLMCSSILMTTYIIECYLYFFYPVADKTPTAIANIAKNQGIENFDTRTKIQVVKDLRATGIDAYPSIHPSMLFSPKEVMWKNPDVFPLGGIANTNTVFCNESGKYITYQSDEHGFNNKSGMYKKLQNIDVVLIGDSFTQGACVPPDKNFAGNLTKHSLNVLNLGNAGSGPLIEYAIFKEYVTKIKPKIVLWIFCEHNDMDDLLKEQRVPVLRKYFTDDNFTQNLFIKQNSIDSALKVFVNNQINQYKNPGINFESIFKLWEIRSRMGLLNKKNSFAKNTFQDQEMIFSNILLKTNRLTTSWNGHFCFVYLPGHYGFSSDNSRHYHMIMNIIQKLQIQYIDIFEILSSHSDPLSLFPFRLPLHYNEEGYKIVSDELLKMINTLIAKY